MQGITDKSMMLQAMQPELLPGQYVFLSFRHAVYGDYAELEPIGSVMEKEGLTLVVDKQKAEARGMAFEAIFHCISLNLHSSLQATGLTAAISSALADAGVACNVFAGYYHDHIFVPESTTTEAMQTLMRLSETENDFVKN